MEQLKEFIKPELLVLIPVLLIIGKAVVHSHFENKLIPFILMGIGIALSGLWVFATSSIKSTQEIALAVFTALVQGVLVAGASVLVNESAKQLKK